MIRILQVLPSLNVCGGVENYLMNYYTHMDGQDVRFDFAVHAIDDEHFKKIIEQNGDKIYKLPPFTIKNLKEIKRQIKRIFQTEKYDIIHCHQANAAYFYFKIAKKCGIKCRILHSHQSRAADKFTHALRNKPLLFLGKKYSTAYFACSKLAGKYLFGKNYTVIVNAIDTGKFAFNGDIRKEIRTEHNISADAVVLGHIGRMCPQKNQSFLLDIFAEVNKQNENSYLFLIGGGEDRQFLENKASNLGIADKVLFTGTRTDTYRYYSAMDIFVLPSVYEGLPVVGVEAQCNGLPVITSTNVTDELKMLPTTEFISLKKNASVWAEICLARVGGQDRLSAIETVGSCGYEISSAVRNLADLYESLYNKYYR